MNKLYLVYLGANCKERFIEDHEILLVIASDKKAAKQKAKEKSKLTDEVHVDMILEVNNVDGFDVSLEKGGNEKILRVSSYDNID